jgi:RNA polymerase sigma-70 factor (ECF subfamily)
MAVRFRGVRLESDEQVYARVRAGDRAALAGLVERYHGPLLKFLVRMTGQTQSAEDLVQDTFIRLLTFHGTPPERFRPWIYQVARNLARDTFRSAVVRRELVMRPDSNLEDQAGAVEHDVENLAQQAWDGQHVIALLQRLPENQREALVLRFYHEMPLEEIAEITGAPLGTVKSRLFHGLRRARQLLELDEVKQYERK